MIGVVRVKPGVRFDVIKEAGFWILGAIQSVARKRGIVLRITSGTDGTHSGPTDPHKLGEAYDVGSQEHGDQKHDILADIILELGTEHFFCFLEDEGTANEHFHCQRKKGTTFPPEGV